EQVRGGCPAPQPWSMKQFCSAAQTSVRRGQVLRRLKVCSWQEALSIFSELRQEGALSAALFTALSSAQRRAARWEGAVQLLEQMPKDAIRPDVVNFNATISACSAASQWPAAIALLQSMQMQQVSGDLISYNATMSACDHAAETTQAAKCMLLMRAAAVQPDATSYSTLMSAITRSGDWRAVCRAWDFSPGAMQHFASLAGVAGVRSGHAQLF
ncbi:unnamed protein product, partial [Effrenium voratum]